MKKLLAPLILLTITVSLLSSCYGPSNMAVTKRHYRSGYYVDWGTRKKVIKTSAVYKIAEMPQTERAVISTKPEVYTVQNVHAIVSEKAKAIPAVKNTKHLSAIANKISIPEAESQKSTTINDNTPDYIQNVAEHHQQESANVAFVVVVLCAIFIPPVGVALMYGIHSYFWIDLILTLLFFFPGMIFALIVVLM
jgi:uncharacterized membrane protein YqaE (UPF0057 family)